MFRCMWNNMLKQSSPSNMNTEYIHQFDLLYLTSVSLIYAKYKSEIEYQFIVGC